MGQDTAQVIDVFVKSFSEQDWLEVDLIQVPMTVPIVS